MILKGLTRYFFSMSPAPLGESSEGRITRLDKKVNSWNDSVPSCNSCRTRRHPRSWRGFCARCYPLIAKIEKIDRGLYRRRGRWAGRRKDENAYIRKSAVRELADLKTLEAPLVSQATGFDIEGLLITISEVAGADTDRIDGARYVFGGCVGVENMGRVYELLLRIVETLPSKWARRPNARRPFWHREENEKNRLTGRE